MRNVEKLNPGDSVDHFFLIHRATQGVTAQGKDYMTLFLQDKSGDIEAKLRSEERRVGKECRSRWSPYH